MANEVGEQNSGFGVHTGQPVDIMQAMVVEPLRVKTQAIFSAAEAAIMILRIDDVIAPSQSAAPEVCTPHGGRRGMPRGIGE